MFTNLLLQGQDAIQGHFKAEFYIPEFSEIGCRTKAKEPRLSNYLPTSGMRINGFIPFPTVLMLCETKSTQSWIWTRVPCPFPMTMTITRPEPSLFVCIDVLWVVYFISRQNDCIYLYIMVNFALYWSHETLSGSIVLQILNCWDPSIWFCIYSYFV